MITKKTIKIETELYICDPMKLIKHKKKQKVNNIKGMIVFTENDTSDNIDHILYNEKTQKNDYIR